MAFFLLHSVPLQFSAVKFPLGTGMSSGRSTLLFSTNHDINEIPGCSLSVRHLVWDQAQAGSTPVTRTKSPLKSAISEGFSLSIAAQGLSMELLLTDIIIFSVFVQTNKFSSVVVMVVYQIWQQICTNKNVENQITLVYN